MNIRTLISSLELALDALAEQADVTNIAVSAEEIPSDFEELTEATAGVIKFSYTDAVKVSDIKRPVQSKELMAALGKLEKYGELLRSAIQARDHLNNASDKSATAKEAVERADKLIKGYTDTIAKSRDTVVEVARTHFPARLNNDHALALSFVKSNLHFDKETSMPLVWFRPEGDCCYGMLTKLDNVTKGNSEYPVYCVLLMVELHPDGSGTFYAKTDSKMIDPITVKVGKSDNYNDAKSLTRRLQENFDLDDVQSGINQVALPLDSSDIERLKEGDYIEDIKVDADHSLLVTFKFNAGSQGNELQAAINQFRIALSSIFGDGVTRATILRHQVVAGPRGNPTTVVDFTLLHKPSVNDQRGRTMLRALDHIKHDLGLERTEYESLTRWIRANVQ